MKAREWLERVKDNLDFKKRKSEADKRYRVRKKSGKESSQVVQQLSYSGHVVDLVEECACWLCVAVCCGSSPELILDGDLDVTYTGVPVLLEYVMTELLKNSYRATTKNFFKSQQQGSSLNSLSSMPPVVVSIAQSANHVSLQIRDQGGGISPQNLPHVFSYAFTMAGSTELEDAEETGGGLHAMQAVGGSGGDALAEMGKMDLALGFLRHIELCNTVI